jgi:hypothetical protein
LRLARIKTIHACRARRKNTFFPRKIRGFAACHGLEFFSSRLRAAQTGRRTKAAGRTYGRGRISVFEPALSETPSTKHQGPEKFQNSNTKPQYQMLGRTTRRSVLSLELGASLELGNWELGAFCCALSFSKLEVRPPAAWSEGLT